MQGLLFFEMPNLWYNAIHNFFKGTNERLTSSAAGCRPLK
ncbi:hypothetical protein QY97_01996 [Bacillus thermotolerans]|uniref:Uncharacterized protein n=1 Tax=Bacillus thermotolerans TaxID=1221996 RepID=A0A0F5HQK4_BACTR|nr:hypothetical protein QY97_01996 [Bacillus thermotolerans]KKB43384.1 hypothetical protein QY95_01629 [Bacillus thermotolerans]KKB43495.1 hypothetical protein QY96_00893 [Bacillus thermotolerans]